MARLGWTLLWTVLLAVPSALAAPNQEYQVKAAFLYNFAQFTEWPDGGDPERPFIIGILGEDPFGEAVDSLQNETIHDRPVQVRRYSRVDEAADADLLYVSTSHADAPEFLDGKRALTVGDGASFAERGGVIGFVVKGNKVRFVINRKKAEEKGLRFNSQLLTLADRVVS